jgi:hypothetical protein
MLGTRSRRALIQPVRGTGLTTVSTRAFRSETGSGHIAS